MGCLARATRRRAGFVSGRLARPRFEQVRSFSRRPAGRRSAGNQLLRGEPRRRAPEGANMFKAVLDDADLTRAFLYGAQFLNCAQLVATRNWQSAFRDDDLGCGAPIPPREPSG